MRVLFLSQRVPYPPNRGDKITTWRLVERMRRRHEVAVVAFAHDEADEEAADALRGKGIEVATVRLRPARARLRSLPLLLTGRPLTLGFYGSRELQDEVDRRAPDADVAYAYSSSMGAFLLPYPELPRIMHLAELDADKWRQYAERSSPPGRWVYRREHRTLLEFERELARTSATNVLCTPAEERIFREQIPNAPSTVLRNGVDLEAFRPSPETAVPGRIVFTGVMNYMPNVDGCVHFVLWIFPDVLEKHPEATFEIVGANPTQEVERLGLHPLVRVTGTVPDVREHLREASIAVAPLRIARGIQNKVLEALAMGLPVVATTVAAQGVEGVAGEHFLVADEPEAFAAAVNRLLGDPVEARRLGAAGRALVEERYDWERCLAPLDDLLEAAARGSSRAVQGTRP